jgi:dCTP deaminase
MILSDRDIHRAMCNKEITITPWPAYNDLQPASIDLHLGKTIQLIDNETFGIRPGESPTYCEVEHHTFCLYPGDFVLGYTKEKVELSDSLVARVEGKSSLGRAGLAVHVTAGFIDPGFCGNITLEIVNHSGHIWELAPNMKICQIAFERLSSPAIRPYGHHELKSKYQNQKGVKGSDLSNI